MLIQTHPRFIFCIEVAESFLPLDRNTKLPLYAASGIPEYWIINIEDACIEIYREPATDTYSNQSILHAGDQLSCQAFPDHQLAVTDVLPAT